MIWLRRLVCALVATFPVTPLVLSADSPEPLNLALPTENDAIFRGGGAEFYQHIERDYKGEKSMPWQGGQYGFVRNPVETAAGLIYSRFHEGIDIRPLHRDATGEPLDTVHAIADGTVVHTNTTPGWSNYGNYIVIEHRFGGSPYFSLYGHLKNVSVRAGQHVARGEQIAVMGYTGEGLNQARAHVHLELNMMLSRQFERWHDTFYKDDPNHHGIYNGINLVGVDIARLYLALRERPSLTIPEFLANEEAFYRVSLPGSKHFDLLRFYPWLVHGKAEASPASWEVSFNRAGVPLKIEPASERETEPKLSYVKKRNVDYSPLTRGVVGGSGANAALSDSGRALMRLLIFPD